MNKRVVTNVALAVMLLSCVAFAQDKSAATDKPKMPPPAPTTSNVMDRIMSGIEREVVPAAEAMPEEKYSFAPTNGEFKGVRTFAEQVKHIAAVNLMLAAAMQEQAPVAGPEAETGPKSVTSKADIVKYLKDSFAEVHKAIRTVDEKNLLVLVKSPFGPGTTTRLAMGMQLSGHNFDHYGQMVEYLRMNGIIPPASRT